MNTKKAFNHNLAVFGWGALFIWWGLIILIDPITLGMGAMGTGLIMLGINAIRAMRGIRTVASTTRLGITILAWGALDEIRLRLGLPAGVSFALVFFVIGLNIWVTGMVRRGKAE